LTQDIKGKQLLALIL